MSASAAMSSPMNIQHKRTPSAFFSPPAVSRSVTSQCGTSWTEAFDFASRSPLTSALHFGTSPKSVASMSMSCSPGSLRNGADYFNFERDYCSNFSCCGLTLPDMHALVAHFEETHVVLADEHGQPIGSSAGPLSARLARRQCAPTPPESSSGADAPAAPSPISSAGPETPPAIAAAAAHVQAYEFPNAGPPLITVPAAYARAHAAGTPSPMTPSPIYSVSSAGSFSSYASPISPASSYSSHSSPASFDGNDDVMMDFDPLDDACVPSMDSTLDSTPPSPLSHPIRPSSVLRSAAVAAAEAETTMCLPPALFTAPSSGKSSRAGSPGVGAMRREKSSKKGALGPMASILNATSSLKAKAVAAVHDAERVLEPAAPAAAETSANESGSDKGSSGGKRQREKAYKCMKPGCTKSYLNPNGLKYHNSKGTCTFETSRSGSPVASAAPSALSTSRPAAPAPTPLMVYAAAPSRVATPVSSMPASPVHAQPTGAVEQLQYQQQQQLFQAC
ncbi:hypothetical protein DFH11DRAFT_472480 [Phellopilus nigrolimitatus]|nr:hypothetical protein DFH11DRAFT_472480 [Phellopilus nigrolimitatus]